MPKYDQLRMIANLRNKDGFVTCNNDSQMCIKTFLFLSTTLQTAELGVATYATNHQGN
jgi:hypothetical protein